MTRARGQRKARHEARSGARSRQNCSVYNRVLGNEVSELACPSVLPLALVR